VARRRAAEEAAHKGEQSGQPQNKKKRKRKVRYPKDFDPANPGPLPHPERWLPKWQRSDFKKKRKSRKEKQVGHALLCHLHKEIRNGPVECQCRPSDDDVEAASPVAACHGILISGGNL